MEGSLVFTPRDNTKSWSGYDWGWLWRAWIRQWNGQIGVVTAMTFSRSSGAVSKLSQCSSYEWTSDWYSQMILSSDARWSYIQDVCIALATPNFKRNQTLW